MALYINGIRLTLEQEEAQLSRAAAKALGISEGDIRRLRVKRISLDARKKEDICFSYGLEIELDKGLEKRILARGAAGARPMEAAAPREVIPGDRPLDKPIVIVGLGPAGLFAAHTLARHGYRPIVIERGRPLARRGLDVEGFWGGRGLDTESNIMFGEGGAGAYSDGKLTTRIKDGRAEEVLSLLESYGGPKGMSLMAKPHIGTDRLVEVVGGMRRAIEAMGAEVRFSTKLTGLTRDDDGRLKSVTLQSGESTEELPCAACILAIGQGARDTYRMLLAAGLELTPKAFAVGVRIEHPRELIDRAQYGRFMGHPRLGAAEYQLTGKHGERGVYTFCMCPGGVVVASSSGEGQVVTNGMSRHARDGENSNSALVVQVSPADYPAGPLGGVAFQEELERGAFLLGGGDYTAPAQRVEDYVKRLAAPSGFGGVRPSYRPGVAARDLYACLPEFVAEGVRAGIAGFGRKLKGFDLPDAVITAVESRTSVPVRINRGEDGCATRMPGLYPVGEGAGYAGGIVSAAVDGMRAAEGIIGIYSPL